MTRSKNGRKQSIIITLIGSTLQVLLCIALIILQHYTRTTAGVSRHIIYKKSQYMSGILNATNLNVIMILGIVSGMLLLVFLIKTLRKKEQTNAILICSFSLAVIFSFAISIEAITAPIKDLAIFPYLLLVTAIIWGVEILKCILIFLSTRKKPK